MQKVAKIAISLPKELLQGIDTERRSSGQTRSAFFRRAVEDFLRREREGAAIDRYVLGYEGHPETDDEIALAEFTAQRALEENPWAEGPRT